MKRIVTKTVVYHWNTCSKIVSNHVFGLGVINWMGRTAFHPCSRVAWRVG